MKPRRIAVNKKPSGFSLKSVKAAAQCLNKATPKIPDVNAEEYEKTKQYLVTKGGVLSACVLEMTRLYPLNDSSHAASKGRFMLWRAATAKWVNANAIVERNKQKVSPYVVDVFISLWLFSYFRAPAKAELDNATGLYFLLSSRFFGKYIALTPSLDVYADFPQEMQLIGTDTSFWSGIIAEMSLKDTVTPFLETLLMRSLYSKDGKLDPSLVLEMILEV